MQILQDIQLMIADVFVMANLPFLIMGLLAFGFWIGFLTLRERNAGFKQFMDMKELEHLRNERLHLERELRKENYETGLSLSLTQKLEMMEPSDDRFMAFVPIDSGLEGIELARSVLIDGQNALMKRGTTLTKERIMRLVDWGVTHVWIKRREKKII